MHDHLPPTHKNWHDPSEGIRTVVERSNGDIEDDWQIARRFNRNGIDYVLVAKQDGDETLEKEYTLDEFTAMQGRHEGQEKSESVSEVLERNRGRKVVFRVEAAGLDGYFGIPGSAQPRIGQNGENTYHLVKVGPNGLEGYVWMPESKIKIVDEYSEEGPDEAWSQPTHYNVSEREVRTDEASDRDQAKRRGFGGRILSVLKQPPTAPAEPQPADFHLHHRVKRPIVVRDAQSPRNQ